MRSIYHSCKGTHKCMNTSFMQLKIEYTRVWAILVVYFKEHTCVRFTIYVKEHMYTCMNTCNWSFTQWKMQYTYLNTVYHLRQQKHTCHSYDRTHTCMNSFYVEEHINVCARFTIHVNEYTNARTNLITYAMENRTHTCIMNNTCCLY